MLDIKIMNGTIVDGTGRARYRADVGIQGERISDIGDLAAADAALTIQATGHIVAPGFIDVHTHSDGWLLTERCLASKLSQGVTTEFLGLDGIAYAPVSEETWREWFRYLYPLNGLSLRAYRGWETIGDYGKLLDGCMAQNAASFIPYANVRTLACGFGARQPDDYQMYEIKRQIQLGLEEGALGLSTGLDYIDECFASTEELVAACSMLGRERPYVTHVRYALGTLAGVKEAVDIGRRAGTPVHISHLKSPSPVETEAILHYIDTVAVNEVAFSFDVYPYLATSTMLQYLLPHEVWRDGPIAAQQRLRERRLRASLNRTLADSPLADIKIAWLPGTANADLLGQSLATLSERQGKSPADAVCDLLLEEGMAVLLVFHLGDDDLVAPFLAHDCYTFGSDGIYFPNALTHPRQFGSATRILGYWARDRQLFTLESAVRKLSGLPAATFKLSDRGTIQTGRAADIVTFDPENVGDRATYDAPQEHSVGIHNVLVNGTLIRQNEQFLQTCASPVAGRFLRI